MKRILKKAGMILCVASLVIPRSVSAAGSGGLPGFFLNMPINSISMSVSTPDEINPSYLNPAGLFMVNQSDVTLLFNTLYAGGSFNYICYSYPVRLLGTFAVSRVGISGGEFDKRDPRAVAEGVFTTGESVYLITYAHKLLPWMVVGSNFKVTNQNLDEYKTYNIGNDVGIQLMPVRNLYLGFNIQNFVRPKMKLQGDTDNWPTNVNMGFVYNRLLAERLSLAADFSIFDVATDDDVFDTDNFLKWSYNFHYGMKYTFMNSISARMGIDRREYNGGLSLFYRGFQLDYTFGYSMVGMGANHRISTTGRFGLDRATREEERLRRLAERDRLLRPVSLYKEAMGMYGEKKNWDAAFHFGEIPAMYTEYDKADKAIVYSAEAMQRLGMKDAALGIYRQALTKFPMSSYKGRILYKMMKLHYEKGELDKALGIYARIQKQFAKSKFFGPASYLAGQCYYRKKMYDNALETFKLIPERDESYIAAQYTSALCMLQAGKMEGAIDFFRAIIAQPDKRITLESQKLAKEKATLNLAHLYYQLARYDDALVYYGKIGKDSKRYTEALNGRAWCHINKREFDKAISILQGIIDADPGSDAALDATLSLAHCYAKLDRHQDAAELYRNIITAVSEHDIMRLKKSNTVEKLGQARIRMDDASRNLANIENLVATNTIQVPKLRRNRRHLLAQYERYHTAYQDELDEITGAERDLKRKAKLEKVLQSAQYALPMMVQKMRVSQNKDEILGKFQKDIETVRARQDSAVGVIRSEVVSMFDQQSGRGNYTEEQVEEEVKKRSVDVVASFAAVVDSISDVRDAKVEDFTRDERKRRGEAIEQYRQYLLQYHDISSADVMLQLAQLYYDKEKDDYMNRMDAYDKQLEKFYNGEMADIPEEPRPDYRQTVSLYNDLIKKYPDSPSVDRALYAMGFCYIEQGERDRARNVFLELVEKYPGSIYYPEANLRIGEYHFMNNNYERAIGYYKKVLPYKDNPHFEKALYKLGWSYYNLNDYENAINTFIALVDLSESEKRDSDLKKEAMDYIAISFNEYGGLENMVDFFRKIGGRSYEDDLLYKIGDVYKTIDKTYAAVDAYKMLLQRFPDYPMAAEVQHSIVDCHKRNRDDEATIAARETYIKEYGPGSPWREKHKDNDKLMRMADNFLEENVHDAAIYYHAKFRRDKDVADLDDAVRQYRSYLKLFPKSERVYRAHNLLAEALYEGGKYEDAATEFHKIAFDYKDDTKYREDAAYNVILCYQLLKKELSSDEEANKVALGELNQKIIKAAQDFKNLLPASERVAQLLFVEGAIHFAEEKYAASRKAYETIIKEYPQNKQVSRAYELIALTYSKEKNFVKSEEWYKKLMDSGTADPEKTGQLKKFVAASIYANAAKLQEEKNLKEAAAEYERLVNEVPDYEEADGALASAGLCYEQMENWGYAVRAYERLANDYPNSKRAEEALFRAGASHEKLENWELAAENYWQAAQNYPQSEYASKFLYNAGRDYEKIKDFDKAALCYRTLGEKYPDSEVAPDAFLGIAETYVGNKQWDKAAEIFGQFARTFTGDKSLMVEAMCREGICMYEGGRIEEARIKMEEAVLNSKRYRDINEFWPAKTQYYLGEIAYAPYAAIEFKLPVETMRDDVKRKSELLKDVIRYYAEAVRSGVAEWATAATYKLGLALENYAMSLLNQERQDLDETNKFAFEIQLRMSQVPQFLLKSSNYFKANVEKARKAKFTNENIEKSEVKLMETTFRIATIYEEIANLYRTAPLPDGLSQAEKDDYRFALEDKAFGFEDNAVIIHETNLKYHREYGIKNEWLQKSLQRLAAILPDRYSGKEVAFAAGDAAEADTAVQAAGDGRTAAQRDSLKQLAKQRAGSVSDTLLDNLVKQDTTQQILSLDDLLKDVESEKPIMEKVADWKKIEQEYLAQAKDEEKKLTAARDSVAAVVQAGETIKLEVAKLQELDKVIAEVRDIRTRITSMPAPQAEEMRKRLGVLDRELYDLAVPPLSNMSGIMKLIKYTRRNIKHHLNGN